MLSWLVGQKIVPAAQHYTATKRKNQFYSDFPGDAAGFPVCCSPSASPPTLLPSFAIPAAAAFLPLPLHKLVKHALSIRLLSTQIFFSGRVLLQLSKYSTRNTTSIDKDWKHPSLLLSSSACLWPPTHRSPMTVFHSCLARNTVRICPSFVFLISDLRGPQFVKIASLVTTK